MRWICLLFLVGCCRHGHLNVKHEYLHASYLAASHVDSPDPRRCSFRGEQLIIQWNFPEVCEKMHLLLKMRTRGETLDETVIPVCKRKGTYVYRVGCGDKRILTYQIEVRSKDRILETWSHQVWTQLMELEE